MTVVDHSPRRTAYAPRFPRRHEIVTTGGMEGVLRIGGALQTCGYAVHEFVVDVRDGVTCSAVTCTVALTADETELFAERLRELPTVLSVDPR